MLLGTSARRRLDAALVEPLAVSLHTIRMSAFTPRVYTMVMGAGMIGPGVIAHLRSAGAGLIIATEMNHSRLKLAKEFGADYVFNPQATDNLRDSVLDLTDGNGVDVVFECSGVSQAFRSATKFARRGGQILLVGQITHEVPILPTDFTPNELQLQGICCHYAEEFPMVVELLERGVPPVGKVLPQRLS
jgi:(R,R)-butanediol dehydrogenase / meso-butanediol dehydrogenase / diacetyl reductase